LIIGSAYRTNMRMCGLKTTRGANSGKTGTATPFDD
jgi:hypothetical protein